MSKALLIAVVLFTFSNIAFAVPQYINYQGMLRDASGNVQTGTFSMIFRIYADSSGGTALFDSGATSVSVSNGLYNVPLGTVGSSVFTGADRYLEITVGSDILSPRLKINSVAYAINAENAATASYAALAGTASSAATASANYAILSGTASSAATVSDNSISTAKIQDSAVTAAKLASDITVSTTGNITGNNYTINGTLSIPAGTNKIAGTGTIGAPEISETVLNVPVTASSLIILTVGHAGSVAANPNNNGGIRISAIGTNQFTVSTMNGAVTTADIPFSYLIIN